MRIRGALPDFTDGGGALDNTTLWGLILLPFVLLGVLVGVGALINLVAKRPVFNGAAVCFWIVLGVVVAMHVVLFTAPRATFQTGVVVGEPRSPIAQQSAHGPRHFAAGM